MLAKVYSPRCIFERMRIYESGTALRELAFAPIGKRFQEIFSRQQFQNGVSQKFQTLVVLDGGGIRGIGRAFGAQLRNRGAVRQSALEKVWVSKPVAETVLKLSFVALCHFLWRCAQRRRRLFRRAQLRGA